MTPKNDIKIVKITDISSEDLERLLSDYTDSGAEVTTTKQPDGRWTVEARFPVGTKYRASERAL
jgi:hypothetical protein